MEATTSSMLRVMLDPGALSMLVLVNPLGLKEAVASLCSSTVRREPSNMCLVLARLSVPELVDFVIQSFRPIRLLCSCVLARLDAMSFRVELSSLSLRRYKARLSCGEQFQS